jgi:xanthine/uracil permease
VPAPTGGWIRVAPILLGALGGIALLAVLALYDATDDERELILFVIPFALMGSAIASLVRARRWPDPGVDPREI